MACAPFCGRLKRRTTKARATIAAMVERLRSLAQIGASGASGRPEVANGIASRQKPRTNWRSSRRKKRSPAKLCGPTRGSAQPHAADSTLRVDIGLLNRMMNLVGELVLTRNQILQANSADAGVYAARAPPGYGHRRPARGGDEGSHAAGESCFLEVSAPGARSCRSSSTSACACRWKARRRSSTRACSRPSRIP